VQDPNIADIRDSLSYEEAFVGNPLVSVMIHTYHRAAILCERTLPTVFFQTYDNWEVVIVGDGCEDDTGDRIEALRDARIRYSNLSANGPYPDDPIERSLAAGTYSANAAIAQVRGQWIAPLNDDDEWTEDHIAILLREAQRSRAELIYGMMRVLIEGTGEEATFGLWPPQIGDFGFQAAIYHAGFSGFRVDPTAYQRGEPGDWDLARRMLDAGVRFGFLPRIVGSYHLAPNHRGQAWWSERARR